MANKRILRDVGKISDKIVDKYNLQEYRGKKIVQALDLYAHTYKHKYEFQSVTNYNNAVNNIAEIISNPLFVYYDRNKNSLLYFKKIDEDVCAVVKLTLRKNKECYVSTIYPINEQKIQKYIEQSYIKGQI